jgi:hypothetical protein
MKRMLLGYCLTIFTGALPAVGQSTADPLPDANPARPTLSTPATLPPVGYIQFETGTLGATTSPEFSARLGINQVTKLALTPRLEVQTEPFVRSWNGAGTAIHPGELFAGAQAVLLAGHDQLPTIAVSYTRRLYESPAPELDLGTFRQSAVLLVSKDLAGFHLDGNLIVTEQTLGGVRRAQHAQTLSISHPFRKITIGGEAWHFSQPFLRDNAVGLLSEVSYALRRNLIFDLGVDRGLTGTSTHWEDFIGFTYLLPHRLWHR